MIIINKKKKITPSLRWKKNIKIFDNSFIYFKDKKYTKSVIIKKKIYSENSINLNLNLLKYLILITKRITTQTKPYKKFILSYTSNNFNINLPGLQFLNVGKVLYNVNIMKSNMRKIYFKGFITYLKYLPINTYFSNVLNKENTKITYIKAAGTFSKLQKTKKNKKKLILIILPSKNRIFLHKYVKVYVGKNTNFNINKLNEGKFGFSFKKKKKIAVRGVAMNPVDHPNGGRTKTVQPEKSPWNWIAKKKK